MTMSIKYKKIQRVNIKNLNKNMTTIELYNTEINKEIAKPEIQKALLATTFKGLNLQTMKQAMIEGMMRGFVFKDFLEKNVYAIPFKDSYSLITSIDYARKIAMKSGLAGKSAPTYTFDKDGKIETCSVTVKRNVDGYVGEYTATIYFGEYSTGRNLWLSKPKTMIAKVAEMHALRAGFPEEMAKQYVEEEVEKEVLKETVDEKYLTEINTIKTISELKTYYLANKGRGKAFDKAVIIKKQALQNENI